MNESPEKGQVIRDLIEAAAILEVAARRIAEDTHSHKVALNMARRAWNKAIPGYLEIIESNDCNHGYP